MKTKKNTKSFKLLALIFVLLIAGMSLTACSKGEQPASSNITDATEQTSSKNTVPTLSTEQKKEKFEEIIQNIQNSKTIDEAKAYFYGVDESNLADEIDYIKSFKDYTDVMINVVAETDTSFYITRMDYTVSSENGNAHRSSNQSTYFVSLIDGEWKLDFTTDENSEIVKLANEQYDSQFNGNVKNYDNFIKMNGLYDFFITSDEQDCFKDMVETIVFCTYQDAEGNVYVVTRLNNGNPAKSQTFNQYSVKLTDDVLGTIVDTTIDANDTLSAGTGKNVTIKISKDQVLTGTQKWNNVSSDFNSSYSD